MRSSMEIPASIAAEPSRPALFLALTKPDVSFLVVMTTASGYALGTQGPLDLLRMAHTVFAPTLIAAVTSALNHYIERDTDALMRRTASPPLPSGQLQPREALMFGATLLLAGTLYLMLASGALATILGIMTSAAYLCVYTPLKRRTTLATFIGAFPGAVPPLIGWAAARGTLSINAWILLPAFFFGQFPPLKPSPWCEG